MTLRLIKRDEIWYAHSKVNGKLVRKSLGTKNKKEAQIKLDVLNTSGAFGRSDDGDYTVMDAYKIWMRDGGSKRNRTSQDQARMWADKWGRKKMKDLSDNTILQWIADNPHMNNGGHRTYLSVLRAVINAQVKVLKRKSNPPHFIDWPEVMPPKGKGRRGDYFTASELKKVLKAAYDYAARPRTRGGDTGWGDYFMVAVGTGARPSSYGRLKKKDLEVTPSGKARLKFTHSKGKSKTEEEYYTYIDTKLRDILIERCDGLGADDYIFGCLTYNNGPVLNNVTGAAFKKILEPTGLTGTPYKLRHSYGVYTANLPGSSMPAIQQNMGHSNITTTMLYVVAEERAQVDAAEGLAGAVFGGDDVEFLSI